MDLTVLGCSGGWPAAGRACSGYLLRHDDTALWVDAGTGSLPVLLEHTRLEALGATWISHLHTDHCGDLPAVYHAIVYGKARRDRLRLLGPPGLSDHIGRLVEGDPAEAFEVIELFDGRRDRLGAIAVESLAVSHGMPAFGLRVNADGRTFGYSGDTASCEAVTHIASATDLFLCQAFVSHPNAAEFSSVMSPTQAAVHAARGGADRLILTHLHPDTDPKTAVDAARRDFAGAVEAAEPGHRYSV